MTQTLLVDSVKHSTLQSGAGGGEAGGARGGLQSGHQRWCAGMSERVPPPPARAWRTATDVAARMREVK